MINFIFEFFTLRMQQYKWLGDRSLSQLRYLPALLAIYAIIKIMSPVQAQQSGYLHVEGSRIVNASGNRVLLTGINWFGLETESFAPHGLWARNWESMLDQVQDLGFNTIRLPYSNELFDASSMPNGINYDLNPDLEGLSGLEIMDKIIEGAGQRGIKVILDRHRPDARAQSELWYTASVGEERWIDDWVMLAERYAGNETVIGVDLHNEPHGLATWGSGDPATDWRLAAERAGNAILEANPNLLIIVQGIERVEDDWYWWGGNLLGAREHPVRLNVPDRLVYSTHVYGPGVYPQPWFATQDFPQNLPEIWDRHWGYLAHEEIAPVIVGEFGGRSVGDDKEGIWQRSLVSYLRQHNLSYFYWTLNPNSGDTGGLLLDDWQSVDPDKQELLSGYQFPAIGTGTTPTDPTVAPPTAAPVNPEALQVRFRMPHAAAEAQDAKPEFVVVNRGSTAVSLAHVELFYWLDDESSQPLVFRCDWAAMGCSNVMGDFGDTEDGFHYLRLSFRPGAGSIGSGEDSGEIKIRFNRADWEPFQQDNHYSFRPVADYLAWERVTLRVDGNPVWGVEPKHTTLSTPEATTDIALMTVTNTPLAPAATGTATPASAAAGAEATPIAEDISSADVTTAPTPAPPLAPAASTTFVPAGLIGAAVIAAGVLVALGIALGLFLGRHRK